MFFTLSRFSSMRESASLQKQADLLLLHLVFCFFFTSYANWSDGGELRVVIIWHQKLLHSHLLLLWINKKHFEKSNWCKNLGNSFHFRNYEIDKGHVVRLFARFIVIYKHHTSQSERAVNIQTVFSIVENIFVLVLRASYRKIIKNMIEEKQLEQILSK